MTVIARIQKDKTLHIFDEVIEVDSTYFEDAFENKVRKQDWIFETWGNSPENIIESPHNGGWKLHQISGGHGSGALIVPLPKVEQDKLVIEFDWRPVPDRQYTGAFVNIREANPVRGNFYGRTDSKTLVTLRAYSSDNVRIEVNGTTRDYLSPLVTELARYKIEIDVTNNTISFYVNGVHEHTYDFIYQNNLYFEFTFGAFNAGKYSFFDNVKIVFDDGKPMSFTSDGKLYVKNIEEVDSKFSADADGVTVNEIVEGGT